MIGRDAERALWSTLLEGLDAGGTGILIEGAPGVGKTALAAEFEQMSVTAGLRALRAQGAPMESAEPYAGLHLLLLPLRRRFSTLPVPQRRALDIAFGTEEGPPPSQLLVGLATLTLLSEAAGDRGLLVCVEDLHWMDRATRAVLQFVLRRIEQDPILVLLTARLGEVDEQDVPPLSRWTLDALRADAAEQLLDRLPQAPVGATRRALLDLAQGNPLALIELSAADVDADRPAALMPLTAKLERAFGSRFAGLPTETRQAVLAAAVNDSSRAAEALTAAAHVLDTEPETSWWEPAVRAGLVEVGSGAVVFRHPLMRSAVAAAAGEQRSTMLQALVGTVDDRARTVWWRADLALDVDEALADELATLGARRAAAGDAAAAMRALRRAASLSPGHRQRVDRLLAAAESAQHAGSLDIATELLDSVDATTDDPGFRSRAVWLREFLPGIGVVREGGDIRPVLEAIAGMRRAGEPERALGALTFLASMVWGSSPDDRAGALLVESVRDAGLSEGDPRLLFLLAAANPVEEGDRVIAAVKAFPASPDEAPDLAWLLGYALSTAGAVQETAAHLAPAIAGLRRQGQMNLLPHALIAWFWNCYARGELEAARAAADESVSIALDLGDPILRVAGEAIAAFSAAIDGARPDLTSIADGSPIAMRAMNTRAIRVTLTFARGVAALAHGKPQSAARALRRIADPADADYHVVFAVVSLPDLVEAELRLGDRAAAIARLERMEELHRAWRAPLVDDALRFARIIVRGDADVDDGMSLADREPPRSPYLRARAEFLLGMRLRLHERPSESRAWLYRASADFGAAGAQDHEDRVHRELRSVGDDVAGTRNARRGLLSPAELQVAELAADGLTNREIAERLFLSPRTVGAHLYSTFRKLDIGSREGLKAEIGGADVPTYLTSIETRRRGSGS